MLTVRANPVRSNYQSDGRCFDNCTTLSYALAIVQDKSCWCSNLIPNQADQKDIGNCKASCPGYPSDYCGGDGTFGYMEVIGFTPTGTAAAGATTKAPSSSVSTLSLLGLTCMPGMPAYPSLLLDSSPSPSLYLVALCRDELFWLRTL